MTGWFQGYLMSVFVSEKVWINFCISRHKITGVSKVRMIGKGGLTHMAHSRSLLQVFFLSSEYYSKELKFSVHESVNYPAFSKQSQDRSWARLIRAGGPSLWRHTFRPASKYIFIGRGAFVDVLRKLVNIPYCLLLARLKLYDNSCLQRTSVTDAILKLDYAKDIGWETLELTMTKKITFHVLYIIL
jgi:hypothetical protein